MKRLIIADIKSPNNNGTCTGHFFAVARNYQKMFQDSVETLVAGGPVYRKQFAGHLLSLPSDVLLVGESKLKNKWKFLQNARALFRKTHGDTIVVQQGGVITAFLAIALFYHRRSKLFLIQYSREGFRLAAGKLLYRLCKSKIDGIVCPNDMVGQSFGGVPYCVVPDYIYTGERNEPSLSYEEKKYDVCFIGRIEAEKGIIEVAKKIGGSPYRMIIAGKSENENMEKVLAEVCSTCSNIELHIGYLSDEDYVTYIRNSRFCFLNYQGEYSKRSSGVVLDTVFNNVPIIGCRCKALDFIGENGIGYLYDDLQSVNLQEILTKAHYDQYVANIALYKKKHVQYKEKLAKFLGIK